MLTKIPSAENNWKLLRGAFIQSSHKNPLKPRNRNRTWSQRKCSWLSSVQDFFACWLNGHRFYTLRPAGRPALGYYPLHKHFSHLHGFYWKIHTHIKQSLNRKQCLPSCKKFVRIGLHLFSAGRNSACVSVCVWFCVCVCFLFFFFAFFFLEKLMPRSHRTHSGELRVFSDVVAATKRGFRCRTEHCGEVSCFAKCQKYFCRGCGTEPPRCGPLNKKKWSCLSQFWNVTDWNGNQLSSGSWVDFVLLSVECNSS